MTEVIFGKGVLSSVLWYRKTEAYLTYLTALEKVQNFLNRFHFDLRYKCLFWVLSVPEDLINHVFTILFAITLLGTCFCRNICKHLGI